MPYAAYFKIPAIRKFAVANITIQGHSMASETKCLLLNPTVK